MKYYFFKSYMYLVLVKDERLSLALKKVILTFCIAPPTEQYLNYIFRYTTNRNVC